MGVQQVRDLPAAAHYPEKDLADQIANFQKVLYFYRNE